MKVTGNKRWLVLGLCCILSGIMVYVPFLRYSYMEQMIVIFTEYKPIVSPDHAYEFLGDIGGHNAHKYLHTHYFDKSKIFSKKLKDFSEECLNI